MFKNYLYHGGPGSGRYPKGSGENPRAGRKKSKRQSKPISDDDKNSIIKRANIDKAYRKALIENSKIKPAKDIFDQSQSLLREAKKISDDTIKNGTKKEKLNLSNMTDKEMRERIKRQLLENQYNNLFAPEKSTVTKGQRTVNDILSYAGTVATIGSTALGIALTIKQLRGEKS